jgi:hypothetical protein
MNLLLAQADMVLIETSADIIANIIITHHYLTPKQGENQHLLTKKYMSIDI